MKNETKYPKLVENYGMYQFRDKRGKLSEKFAHAWDYCEGFAVVQKNISGPYQFRDLSGNLSEEFYWAGNYNDGFAPVQKKKNGLYQFRDKSGKLSEEFYGDVASYRDGFCRVRKEKVCFVLYAPLYGPYQYRDTSGNLSEEFYDAWNYSDGFALVQKKKNGPFQFRDVNGNLSEEFYDADNYSNGFAKVQKEKGVPWQYRDILGRLTSEKTKSGEDFYRFYRGEIELEDLDDEHFLDPIFCNGVIKECEKRYLKYIDGKYSKNDEVDINLEAEKAKLIISTIDLKQKTAVEKENARNATSDKENANKKTQLKSVIEDIFNKQYGKN